MATSALIDGASHILQNVGNIRQEGGISAALFTGTQNNYSGSNNSYTISTGRRDLEDDEERLINKVLRIDPVVAREELRTAKGHRVEGTCEWITSNRLFQSWHDGGPSRTDEPLHSEQCSPLLQITGGPGRGKTMLSIFLTEHLERDCDERRTTVFFFCSHQSNDSNNTVAVLRGLIYQLLHKQPRLLQNIKPSLQDGNRCKYDLTSREMLWTWFQNMLQDPELATTCIIDGLDECDPESVCDLTILPS
jgi:hypothetical protein